MTDLGSKTPCNWPIPDTKMPRFLGQNFGVAPWISIYVLKKSSSQLWPRSSSVWYVLGAQCILYLFCIGDISLTCQKIQCFPPICRIFIDSKIPITTPLVEKWGQFWQTNNEQKAKRMQWSYNTCAKHILYFICQSI